MRYNVAQRVFIYNTFVKRACWKKCRRKFRRKYPDSPVPSKSMIYRLVAKFRSTGSVLDKKTKRRRRVLTKEKIDYIEAQLEASPRKSLSRLAQQVGVSKSSARMATKLLKMKSYKTRVVQHLMPADSEMCSEDVRHACKQSVIISNISCKIRSNNRLPMGNEDVVDADVAPAWLDAGFLEGVLRENEQDVDICVTSSAVTYVVGKGDNYLSLMLRVYVEFTRSSGEESNKYLVVKSLPAGEFMQSLVQEFGAFQHESQLYLRTMPAMERLVRERTSKEPQPITARGFLCSRPNTLVLEDLKQQGFKMCDRRSQLDYSHCKIALEALGKLHGMSVALRKKDPTLVNEYKEAIFTEETREVGRKCTYVNIKGLGNAVASWPGFERFGEKIVNVAMTCVDRMIEILKPRPGGFRVLNHGDLWTNNMLFRYNDATGEVEDIRLVDFQLSRFASPALDLYYFLYTSPRPEVRTGCWERLLRDYHSSLSHTLAALGCAQEGISFGQLLEEMEKDSFFAVFTACTSFTVVLSGANDLDIQTEESSEIGELNQMVQGLTSPAYKKAFKVMLLEFEKKGLM